MRSVPLSDVAEIVSGATPKTSQSTYWDGDIEWATPADLSKLEGPFISQTPRKITRAGLDSCAAQVLPVGSVLLSSRAPIGHVAINTTPMATNQGFKSLIPKSALDAKYAYHWLRANTALLQSMGNGATFKELSKASVARIEIPLPALDEQRRIAAILDHADSLRSARKRSMAMLDSLAASVFLEMFGDPRTWEERHPSTTIGDLAESVQYGSPSKSGERGAWPILRMGNVTYEGRLDLSDLKYIDLTPAEIPKYTVRRNDLLFNRTNSAEKVGKTTVVTTDQPLAIAGYLVRVRMKPENSAQFVAGYLNSLHGKAVLRGMAKAIVNQANINASEMKSIRIVHPPSDLQFEYQRRVETIEGRRATLEADAARLDGLFASLQSRAFSGQL